MHYPGVFLLSATLMQFFYKSPDVKEPKGGELTITLKANLNSNNEMINKLHNIALFLNEKQPPPKKHEAKNEKN